LHAASTITPRGSQREQQVAFFAPEHVRVERVEPDGCQLVAHVRCEQIAGERMAQKHLFAEELRDRQRETFGQHTRVGERRHDMVGHVEPFGDVPAMARERRFEVGEQMARAVLRARGQPEVVDDDPAAIGRKKAADALHAGIQRDVLKRLGVDHDIEALVARLRVDRFERAFEQPERGPVGADVRSVCAVRGQPGRLRPRLCEPDQQSAQSAADVEHALAGGDSLGEQRRVIVHRLLDVGQADRLRIGRRGLEVPVVQEVVAEHGAV
jgi:hypothetical protein